MIQWLLKRFVSKFYCSRNQVLFYLWWSKLWCKNSKFTKSYGQYCRYMTLLIYFFFFWLSVTHFSSLVFVNFNISVIFLWSLNLPIFLVATLFTWSGGIDFYNFQISRVQIPWLKQLYVAMITRSSTDSQFFYIISRFWKAY